MQELVHHLHVRAIPSLAEIARYTRNLHQYTNTMQITWPDMRSAHEKHETSIWNTVKMPNHTIITYISSDVFFFSDFVAWDLGAGPKMRTSRAQAGPTAMALPNCPTRTTEAHWSSPRLPNSAQVAPKCRKRSQQASKMQPKANPNQTQTTNTPLRSAFS